jgi:septal ring factor EnvC (AmiA/AmiB activator)
MPITLPIKSTALSKVIARILLISSLFFCANATATTSQHTAKLDAVQQQIAVLNQQLTEERATLEKLQTSQAHYQKQFAKQNLILAKQVRTLYKLGQVQALKTVFNPDNFDNLNRNLYYSHYLNSARLNRIAELKQIMATLSSTILTTHKHQQKLTSLLKKKQNY